MGEARSMPTDPTILERLRKATRPDRELDGLIFWRMQRRRAETAYWNVTAGKPKPLPDDFLPPSGLGWCAVVVSSPEYTGSLDAAVALLERVLPGWGWRGGTCCVSDDAFIFPDFNSPEHGERLRREFREDIDWSDLTDIDRRPPGNLPLALLESIFTALKAQQP